MKKLMIISGILALLGSNGLAENPCQQIKMACSDAGYTKGPSSTKGKRLYKDCVIPLMDGKTVSGVNIDPLLVPACKAKGHKGS